MNLFNILAYVPEGEITTQTAAAQHPFVPIDWLWMRVAELGVIESLTFISFGLVCLLYGWRIFKILVVISFAMAGLFGGITIGSILGGTATAPLLGILCCVALGIISIPMMQYSVSILGAAAGGIITGSIWYAIGLPQEYIWAGALIGFVAGGMMSFIIFKAAVILFSSLGGSALLVIALLALFYAYDQTSLQVEELVFTTTWFVPLALIIPTAIGVYIQNKMIKGSQDWSL